MFASTEPNVKNINALEHRKRYPKAHDSFTQHHYALKLPMELEWNVYSLESRV